MQFNILTDKEIAEKAQALILADLSVYDSVKELSLKIDTSVFKLRYAFKKHYGISLFTFSRQQRIERAKQLLTETNYPLQTIAQLVGFEEGNNFQIAFKTVMGMTPGEWRRQNNQAPLC